MISPADRKRLFQDLFAIDTRSLAALRICLGVVLLVDLLQRVPDLAAHYSDAGVLPGAVLLDAPGAVFGIHNLTGDVWGLAFLFVVAGLLAIAMVVGYRTRLAVVLSWLLLGSLNGRNPYLLNNADYLMEFLLLWGIFLPLGATWSIDSARNTSEDRPPRRILSASSIVILIQVVFVYFITALKKTGPEWRWDGTAVYYGLHIDQFVTPLGKTLLQYPDLMRIATHATMVVELVVAFVVFWPWRTAQVRVATIAVFWALHAGILLSFDVGLFPWVSALSWLVFIPTSAWDRLQGPATGPIDILARLFKKFDTKRWTGLGRRPLAWRLNRSTARRS